MIFGGLSQGVDLGIVSDDFSPRELMLAIAEASYETATSVGLGRLDDFNVPSRDVDFSEFIQERRGLLELDMDYVRGRACKTTVIMKPGDNYVEGPVLNLFRLRQFDRGEDVLPMMQKARKIAFRNRYDLSSEIKEYFSGGET
jgi:hypothetical protein